MRPHRYVYPSSPPRTSLHTCHDHDQHLIEIQARTSSETRVPSHHKPAVEQTSVKVESKESDPAAAHRRQSSHSRSRSREHSSHDKDGRSSSSSSAKQTSKPSAYPSGTDDEKLDELSAHTDGLTKDDIKTLFHGAPFVSSPCKNLPKFQY
jgi:hypothetical protein